MDSVGRNSRGSPGCTVTPFGTTLLVAAARLLTHESARDRVGLIRHDRRAHTSNHCLWSLRQEQPQVEVHRLIGSPMHRKVDAPLDVRHGEVWPTFNQPCNVVPHDLEAFNMPVPWRLQ